MTTKRQLLLRIIRGPKAGIGDSNGNPKGKAHYQVNTRKALVALNPLQDTIPPEFNQTLDQFIKGDSPAVKRSGIGFDDIPNFETNSAVKTGMPDDFEIPDFRFDSERGLSPSMRGVISSTRNVPADAGGQRHENASGNAGKIAGMETVFEFMEKRMAGREKIYDFMGRRLAKKEARGQVFAKFRRVEAAVLTFAAGALIVASTILLFPAKLGQEAAKMNNMQKMEERTVVVQKSEGQAENKLAENKIIRVGMKKAREASVLNLMEALNNRLTPDKRLTPERLEVLGKEAVELNKGTDIGSMTYKVPKGLASALEKGEGSQGSVEISVPGGQEFTGGTWFVGGSPAQ